MTDHTLNATQSFTNKNLLIEVPDYDPVLAGNEVTYVRMGAIPAAEIGAKPPPASTDAGAGDASADASATTTTTTTTSTGAAATSPPTERKPRVAPPSPDTRGSDLLQNADTVGPGDHWDRRNVPGPRVFEEDWRTTKTHGHSGSAAAAPLLDNTRTQVGWRDHTDGDRVSTTAGDKLEVIGGNYKLVVQGRQDASSASGLDFSGGHVQDFDAAPGTINEIRWQTDNGGYWKVFEMTKDAQEHSALNGNFVSHYYGSELRTVIGGAQHAYAGRPSHMEIDVPARTTVEERVHAASYDELVRCAGMFSSHVKAKIIENKVTVTANLREAFVAAVMLRTDDSALVIEQVAGLRKRTWLGNIAEVTLGPKVDIVIGGHKQFKADPPTKMTKADLTAAFKGTRTALDSRHQALSSESRAANDAVAAVELKCTAVSSKVKAMEQKLSSATSKVTALTQKIDALQVQVDAMNAPPVTVLQLPTP